MYYLAESRKMRASGDLCNFDSDTAARPYSKGYEREAEIVLYITMYSIY